MKNIVEYGRVVKVLDDNKALVVSRRHKACRDCGGCGKAGSQQNIGDSLIEAENQARAKEGNDVCLEMQSSDFLLGAFLLYIFPLIGLFLGLVLGRYVAVIYELSGDINLWGLAIGILLMATVFLVLNYWEKHFRQSKRFKVVITNLIEDKK